MLLHPCIKDENLAEAMTRHTCNICEVLQARYSSGNYMFVYGGQGKLRLLMYVQEIVLGSLRAARLLLLR